MNCHFNYHPRWHSGNNQSVGSSAPTVSRYDEEYGNKDNNSDDDDNGDNNTDDDANMITELYTLKFLYQNTFSSTI